jgi:hypothetical protein
MEDTASTKPATADDIREFAIDVPEEELEDLRKRINATRWPGTGGRRDEFAPAARS